jgi:hypothetical protein
MTVSPVSRRPSWMAIEPTPPASSTIRIARRSKSANADPLEHQLPGGQGGQRQCCGLREAQRVRLASDDPLVDTMELGDRSPPADGAGVVDGVARAKQAGALSRSTTTRFPSGFIGSATLHVERIDRDRPYLDEKIKAGGCWTMIAEPATWRGCDSCHTKTSDTLTPDEGAGRRWRFSSRAARRA